MKIEEKYTCIGCGYKTLDKEAYNRICLLCGWEDDYENWGNPRVKGGPNGAINLYQHQKKILRHGFPYTWKRFREEEGYPHDYEINKHWEPFEEDYEHLRTVHRPLHHFTWVLCSLYEHEEKQKKKKE